jgi:hypothetical protein
MRYMTNNQPVIILGMHRSGTSMIAKMLDELGLFMGAEKDRYNEAFFFIGLNNWLMKQNSCSWDSPKSFESYLEDDIVREVTIGYLKNILTSKEVVSYLGKKYLKNFKTPFNLNFQWGWKDPRSTYTFPVWKELFPNAKIIHIFRNGVDVANSLKVRHDNSLERVKKKWDQGKYLPQKGLFKEFKLKDVVESIRCSSLEGCFSLWEEYITEARKQTRSSGIHALEICYEEFLSHPTDNLKKILDFCELRTDQKTIKIITSNINESRANAFLMDNKLINFSKSVSDRLKAQGYAYY